MSEILNRQQILSLRIEGEQSWLPEQDQIGSEEDYGEIIGCDGDCACTQAW